MPLSYEVWIAEFVGQLDVIASLDLTFVQGHTEDLPKMWAIDLTPRAAALVVLDRAEALFQE